MGATGPILLSPLWPYCLDPVGMVVPILLELGVITPLFGFSPLMNTSLPHNLRTGPVCGAVTSFVGAEVTKPGLAIRSPGPRR